jgi:hypothetical protein
MKQFRVRKHIKDTTALLKNGNERKVKLLFAKPTIDNDLLFYNWWSNRNKKWTVGNTWFG